MMFNSRAGEYHYIFNPLVRYTDKVIARARSVPLMTLLDTRLFTLMATLPAKLIRKPAKPVSVLAVWALVAQLAMLCCAPAAAAVFEAAGSTGDPQCHHQGEPAPSDSGPACCEDPVQLSVPHALPKSAVPSVGPDMPAVMPATAPVASARLSAPRPLARLSEPIRRSRPYYLSYCAFLE